MLDLTLYLGDVQQEVVVHGDTPLVGAAMNASEGLVTGEEVRNLPLNGRSFDQLILLNPGTVNFMSQRTGGIGTSNSVVASSQSPGAGPRKISFCWMEWNIQVRVG